MNTSRIIGIIFIFVGMGIFVAGMIVTPHVATEADKVTGNYTGHMGLCLIISSIVELIGLLLALIGPAPLQHHHRLA